MGSLHLRRPMTFGAALASSVHADTAHPRTCKNTSAASTSMYWGFRMA